MALSKCHCLFPSHHVKAKSLLCQGSLTKRGPRVGSIDSLKRTLFPLFFCSRRIQVPVVVAEVLRFRTGSRGRESESRGSGRVRKVSSNTWRNLSARARNGLRDGGGQATPQRLDDERRAGSQTVLGKMWLNRVGVSDCSKSITSSLSLLSLSLTLSSANHLFSPANSSFPSFPPKLSLCNICSTPLPSVNFP